MFGSPDHRECGTIHLNTRLGYLLLQRDISLAIVSVHGRSTEIFSLSNAHFTPVSAGHLNLTNK